MSVIKILLADDDTQTRRALRLILRGSGYTVVEARTAEEAVEEIRLDEALKTVLLDLKMPEMGGFEACRRIREVSNVPILVITVCRTEAEKVRAFQAGADSYLTKPFGTLELLSRIYALRRRTLAFEPITPFESSNLRIDFERRRVSLRGQPVHLSPTEFEVLRFLVLNEGKPISHHTLLQNVWGPEHVCEIERLRGMINQLRRAIEPEPVEVRYIQTDSRFGYRFEPVPAVVRPQVQNHVQNLPGKGQERENQCECRESSRTLSKGR